MYGRLAKTGYRRDGVTVSPKPVRLLCTTRNFRNFAASTSAPPGWGRGSRPSRIIVLTPCAAASLALKRLMPPIDNYCRPTHPRGLVAVSAFIGLCSALACGFTGRDVDVLWSDASGDVENTSVNVLDAGEGEASFTTGPTGSGDATSGSASASQTTGTSASASTSGDPTSSESSTGIDPKTCAGLHMIWIADNSRSMATRQLGLQSALRDYARTWAQELDTAELRVSLVTADADLWATSDDDMNQDCLAGHCNCRPAIGCCANLCSGTAQSCFGLPCSDAIEPDELPACDSTFAAARQHSGEGTRCLVEGGARQLRSHEPGFDAGLDCLTRVASHGSERQATIPALLDALSESALAATGCNQGALQPEGAVLLVLSSDSDTHATSGTPQQWADQLIVRMGQLNGNFHVLALVDDRGLVQGLSGGPCPMDDVPGTGDAPQLRAFIEALGPRGHMASICSSDWSEVLEDTTRAVLANCRE